MDSRSSVFRETGIIAAGVILCSAVMLGVFWLLGKWSTPVLLGAAAGSILSIGNFFFMAIAVSNAADKAAEQDVNKGKLLVQGSYFIRLLVLFAILFALAKSGYCQPVALVLPLAFVRPTITVAEFFRKKGDKAL